MVPSQHFHLNTKIPPNSSLLDTSARAFSSFDGV